MKSNSGSDQFLSEDDLNLKDLTWDELMAEWNAWLKNASATDAEDAHLYSHGVFREDPTYRPAQASKSPPFHQS